jgi:hypothetical protein
MPNGSADVSSGAPTPESYTDNGNGTVTDNVTGLMWQQAAPTTTYTLAGAIAYCSTTLSLAGHTDWRLPSFIELISIVDFGLASPSLNAVYFPGTPSAVFWSSTNSTTTAWDVSFVDGSPNEHSGSTLENVRCVR